MQQGGNGQEEQEIVAANGCSMLIINNNPTKLTTTVDTRSGNTGILLLRERTELKKVLGRYVRSNFNLRRFNRRLSNPRCTRQFRSRLCGHGVRCDALAFIAGVSGGNSKNFAIRAINEDNISVFATGTLILTANYHRHATGRMFVRNAHPTNIFATKATRRFAGLLKLVPTGGYMVLNSKSVKLVVTHQLALRNTGILNICRTGPAPSKLAEGLRRYLRSCSVPLRLSRAIAHIFKISELRTIRVSGISRGVAPVPNARDHIRYSALVLSIKLVPRGRLTRSIKMGLSPHAGNPMYSNRYVADVSKMFDYNGTLRIGSLISFISRGTRRTKGSTTTCSNEREQLVRVAPNSNLLCTIPRELGLGRSGDGASLCFHIHRRRGGYILRVCTSNGRVLGGHCTFVHPPRVRGLAVSFDTYRLGRGDQIRLQLRELNGKSNMG